METLLVKARRSGLAAAVALAVWAPGSLPPVAQAQMPPSDPGMTQGMPMGMPQPGMAPGVPAAPAGASMKQIFAGTMAAVLQATGAGVATSIAQGLSGAILSWFSKPKANAPAPAAAMATAMPPMPQSTMGGMDSSGGMGSMGATGGMGSMGGMGTSGDMGNMGASGGMGGMGGMGQAAGTTPADPYAMGAAPPPAAIYAGLAFEVHATGRDGSTAAVDPATHTFATGDRFVVVYRPTLPGQITIYNINPRGEEKQIDAVNVAAGELARLGPYEFRDTAGDEKLRLVLTPCTTTQMVATTRDIVRADAPYTPPAQATPAPGSALGLSECGAVRTRSLGVTTRDIAKVENDGGTLFALDPVSPREMASGQIDPREITIAFRHR